MRSDRLVPRLTESSSSPTLGNILRPNEPYRYHTSGSGSSDSGLDSRHFAHAFVFVTVPIAPPSKGVDAEDKAALLEEPDTAEFQECAERLTSGLSSGQRSPESYVDLVRVLTVEDHLAVVELNAMLLDHDRRLPAGFRAPLIELARELTGLALGSVLRVLLQACGVSPKELDEVDWDEGQRVALEHVLQNHE